MLGPGTDAENGVLVSDEGQRSPVHLIFGHVTWILVTLTYFSLSLIHYEYTLGVYYVDVIPHPE